MAAHAQVYEHSQAMPTERSFKRSDADVIATLGTEPLLRDSIDKMLTIRSVFGDEEAYLADTAGDIVANLQIVASTWQHHPDRAIASVLSGMNADERAEAIAKIRAALDKIEAHEEIVDQVPGDPTPAMLTGTRSLSDRDGALAAMIKVIIKLKEEHPGLVVISGGAEDADQVWAAAAIETDTPFVLHLPNWAYALNYGQDESIDNLMASPLCLGVEYSVERPTDVDWKAEWGRCAWWKDNFVRNRKMIEAAKLHVICGPHRPETIFTTPTIKGGTAACVREMKRLGVERAIYINSEDPSDIVWVNF